MFLNHWFQSVLERMTSWSLWWDNCISNLLEEINNNLIIMSGYCDFSFFPGSFPRFVCVLLDISMMVDFAHVKKKEQRAERLKMHDGYLSNSHFRSTRTLTSSMRRLLAKWRRFGRSAFRYGLIFWSGFLH